MKRPPLDQDPLSLRPLLLLTGLGVALRVALLVLSGEPELQSDEANYVYLALVWDRLGIYLDQHRYLWPPAYTWFLGYFLERFEDQGLFAARLTQVLASASVGLTTMLFAARLFGARAARLAGAIWIVYLPLAVFTHLLWNETLFLAVFLPGLYQVYRVLSAPARAPVDLRLLCAGLLFSLALLLKEAPYYLVPALALCLLVAPALPAARAAAARPSVLGGLGEGLRRASLMLLVVAAVLYPWGKRNEEVYGAFVPVGASLGENVYNGLNAEYRNFDLIPLDVERLRRGEDPVADEVRPWLVEVEAGMDWQPYQWERAEEVKHTIARSEENVRRGLEFAREHPGWLVRSRLKKLADLVTPMSFYTRHLALGHYDSSTLGDPLVRKVTGAWALLCPMAVLLLGMAGFLCCLRDRAGLVVVGLAIHYVLATGLLVAMSRFRVPIEPLLIVLAAGALDRLGAWARGPRRWALYGGWAALLFLWWLNFPEVSTVVTEMVWRRA